MDGGEMTRINVEREDGVITICATVTNQDELDALISLLSAMRGEDKSDVLRQRRKRSEVTPFEIAALAHDIIRDAGRPMKRGEIVSELELRGVPMPWRDKGKNVGTILWRHPQFFEQAGDGYIAKKLQAAPLTPTGERDE